MRSALRALLRCTGADPGAALDGVLAASCARYDVDVAAIGRAAEDPGAAYDALTKLLAAAIDEADRLNDEARA